MNKYALKNNGIVITKFLVKKIGSIRVATMHLAKDDKITVIDFILELDGLVRHEIKGPVWHITNAVYARLEKMALIKMNNLR